MFITSFIHQIYKGSFTISEYKKSEINKYRASPSCPGAPSTFTTG